MRQLARKNKTGRPRTGWIDKVREETEKNDIMWNEIRDL